MQADQMARTFYSSLRNPTIAKLFRFANISENVGFGMGKLFSWKEITGNDVTFESNRNIVSICFHLQKNLNNPTSGTKEAPSFADIKTQQERLAIKLGIKLGENRLSLLYLLYFSPKITGADMAKILDISTTAIDNNIKWLKDNDIIERIGNDRNGYWQVKS